MKRRFGNRFRISAFTALAVLFTSFPALANESVDLRPILYRKYRSTTGATRLYKRFMEDDGSLIEAGEGRKISRFMNHPELQTYQTAGHEVLGEMIRDPRILNAILYLNWNWKTAEQKANAASLIQYYYTEVAMALAEAIDDPRISSGQRAVVRIWLEALERFTARRAGVGALVGFENLTAGAETCVQSIADANTSAGSLRDHQRAAIDRLSEIRRCLVDSMPTKLSMPFASLDMRRVVPNHPGSVVSKTGFIPGNRVQMLTHNRLTNDPEYEQAMTDFTLKVIKPYGQRWDALTDEAMITEMRAKIQAALAAGKNPLQALFIEEAGGNPAEIIHERGSIKYTKADALDIDKNPIWLPYGPANTHSQQIFAQTVKAIRAAESSVFINLFFYGGTMGLSMTDLLLKEMARKPQLKVVVLRDHVNHFGHRAEMRPVFNFLRAYMTLYPKRMLALPANIFEKQVNGYPEFFKGFINERMLRSLGLDEKMSLYLKAQSDHTKLVVVDGDRPQGKPVAMVGSKNWTDASGALCDDSVILVEGPAAVVSLDNYYDDLNRALQESWDVNNAFWKSLYENVHANGWAQDPACAVPTVAGLEKVRKIAQILCPFDVLGRFRTFGDSANRYQLSRFQPISARAWGSDVVRLGENNATATITSINNQNVFSILSAKKQILIHEQLLYSPGIVGALIGAARRGVEVKVMLESFIHEGAEFPGMPNLLFLSDLQRGGVDVKWRLHGPSRQFAPEHHGKTISVDGWTSRGQRATNGPPTLIVGSANKDLLTMKGGFRELQVETFSATAARDHDAYFWLLWNNPRESRTASFVEFDGAPIGQKIRDQGLTTQQFMKYVTEILNTLYAMKPISR